MLSIWLHFVLFTLDIYLSFCFCPSPLLISFAVFKALASICQGQEHCVCFLVSPSQIHGTKEWSTCPGWSPCHILRTCHVPTPRDSCCPWLPGLHNFPEATLISSEASGFLISTGKPLQIYFGEQKLLNIIQLTIQTNTTLPFQCSLFTWLLF